MDHNWLEDVGPGWAKLVQPLIEQAAQQKVTILQVKEKFGGLRFYTDRIPDPLDEMISEAERRSMNTCEKCGEPGVIKGKYWLKCYCDKHHAERDAELKARDL